MGSDNTSIKRCFFIKATTKIEDNAVAQKGKDPINKATLPKVNFAIAMCAIVMIIPMIVISIKTLGQDVGNMTNIPRMCGTNCKGRR
jgi:hypothetical protein